MKSLASTHEDEMAEQSQLRLIAGFRLNVKETERNIIFFFDFRPVTTREAN